MRKFFLVLGALIYSFHGVFAQDSVAVGFAKKINGEKMRSFLEVLASDSLEGRETGKPGQKKAAAFIAGHFRSVGLKPVIHDGYFQHTSLSVRANGGKNFHANEKYFLFMRDYFYPSGLCDSLFVLNKIMFAGYGISRPDYDDYKGSDVINGAVIFFDGAPKGKKYFQGINSIPGVMEKISQAKKRGASLILIITDSLEKIIDDHSYGGHTPPKPDIPYAYVTREMASYFLPKSQVRIFDNTEKKIARTGRPKSFEFSTDAILSFVKNTDMIRGENVLGLLEGTDKKNEVLVLTAHYDHLGKRDSAIYYGADDDGSGTSAIMEMAKLFSDAAKNGHSPRRSILFMAVSGEEKGLLGSNYYVKHPPIPLDNTIANLNTDMIGRTDEKHDSLNIREYVYIIGSDKLSTELHQVNEKANAVFTKLELDYTFNRPEDPNRFYYRSDHYNFAKNNIPIIFYFNGSHRDYHKPSDTIDKIQFDLLEKRTQLIFLTAWELANRPERIRVDVKNDMPNKKEE